MRAMPLPSRLMMNINEKIMLVVGVKLLVAFFERHYIAESK